MCAWLEQVWVRDNNTVKRQLEQLSNWIITLSNFQMLAAMHACSTKIKQHISTTIWGSLDRVWSNGNVLDHRSLPPVFESRRGHIWRVFQLWLRFITVGGRSAHLAYIVHKNGRKTSIIILNNFIYNLQSLSTTTKNLNCIYNGNDNNNNEILLP